MAHAANVKLTIDDFTRIGKRVPVLADLKPSGKHLMSELVAIGGIRPLDEDCCSKAGLLHGDCLTVTGQTMARNLAGVKPYPEGQTIIRPFRSTRSRRTATSSSSTATSPRRRGGQDHRQGRLKFTGKAIVFESEEAALKAILNGTGPKRTCRRDPQRRPEGRPGHARDAFAHQRHHGPGSRQGRRAHHRRTLQRRQPRLRGRPRHAGSLRRRPDRPGQERRPHHHRRRRSAR